MKVIECVFSGNNGTNSASFIYKDAKSKVKLPGALKMTKCPDGKTFYCSATDGDAGSLCYALMTPQDYGIKQSKAYVYITTGAANKGGGNWLKSKRTIDSSEVPVGKGYSFATGPEKPKPAASKPATTKKVSPFQQSNVDASKLPLGDGSRVTTTGLGDGHTSIKDKPFAVDWQWYKEGGIYFIPPDINKGFIKACSYGDRVREQWYNDYTPWYEAKKNRDSDYDIVRKNLNITTGASNLQTMRNFNIAWFNRFKTPIPDMMLSKTFSHVFFTRPDLNLAKNNGSGIWEMTVQAHNDPLYYYLWKNNPDLIRLLTLDFSEKHNFNPYLSNMCVSFELQDEFIKSDEFMASYTGHKIKYGKSNIESKTAGTISLTFQDDDDFRTYKIFKAWVDYISKVYRGEIFVKEKYRRYRKLDYPCSIYYFLCGADGETILFWSKYTGCFPTTIPSAVSSWSKGNMLKLPEYNVTFEYAWKSDFDPLSLVEFNVNSECLDQNGVYAYLRTYEENLCTTGKTFARAPFVETKTNSVGQYVFKLRFRADYGDYRSTNISGFKIY